MTLRATGLAALLLLAFLPGCNLDEARGSGATKHHAEDQRNEDDRAWDEATAEPITCATATPPTAPVCAGLPPTRCVMTSNGGIAWGC